MTFRAVQFVGLTLYREVPDKFRGLPILRFVLIWSGLSKYHYPNYMNTLFQTARFETRKLAKHNREIKKCTTQSSRSSSRFALSDSRTQSPKESEQLPSSSGSASSRPATN